MDNPDGERRDSATHEREFRFYVHIIVEHCADVFSQFARLQQDATSIKKFANQHQEIRTPAEVETMQNSINRLLSVIDENMAMYSSLDYHIYRSIYAYDDIYDDTHLFHSL